jgi:hypothetical protein
MEPPIQVLWFVVLLPARNTGYTYFLLTGKIVRRQFDVVMDSEEKLKLL